MKKKSLFIVVVCCLFFSQPLWSQDHSYSATAVSSLEVYFFAPSGEGIHHLVLSVDTNQTVETPSFLLTYPDSSDDILSPPEDFDKGGSGSTGERIVLEENSLNPGEYILEIYKNPDSGLPMSKGTVTTDENWILTLSLSSTTNLDISIKSQDTNLTDIDPDPIDLNIPPTAEIISPASDVTIDEKKTVTFAGAHSDDDVSSLIHAWDFGDGTTHSTLKDPGLVTFSTAGTFTVTYTVTDDVGQTDSAKVTVTVKEDENPTQPSTPNTPPKGLRVIGSR